MIDSVWMLASKRHGWDHRYAGEDVDPDDGFFLTFEEANLAAHKENRALVERYERYRASVKHQNDNRLAEHEKTVRQATILRDAGEDVPLPRMVSLNNTMEYEDWLNSNEERVYVPVEVKRKVES